MEEEKMDNSRPEGERRKFVRVPFEAMIKCESPEAAPDRESQLDPASAQNLSAGGLLIESGDLFEIGRTLNLKFNVPSREGYSVVEILARVIWSEKSDETGRYRYGLEFSNIDEKFGEAIADFIEFSSDIDEE